MSIRDFRILSRLGEGAYSSVFKVERISDQKEYALKKVKLGGLSDKQLENAVNEVRILASIQSENIVGYKEAFIEGKNLCIVMEFADDGDLYQKIVEKKKNNTHFDETFIWKVLIQVTRGLKTLHNLNIFHRDLKSANVFINKKGQAKLGDMNVSKIAKNGMLYTQTGTPYYACPEVWKDQPYDTKSDIWSMGCVIYEMAALQPPFKGEDMEGLFQSIIKGVYPSIPSFYSRELSSVIKLMLQQNPQNRPGTEKLLKSSLLIKKANELKLFNREQINEELLQTIRIPHKLHYLTQRLPKSKYSSVKRQDQGRISREKRENSLPKLEKLIRYHEGLIRKKDRGHKRPSQSLEVEGVSKMLSNESRLPRINRKQQYRNYYENLLPPLRK